MTALRSPSDPNAHRYPVIREFAVVEASRPAGDKPQAQGTVHRLSTEPLPLATRGRPWIRVGIGIETSEPTFKLVEAVRSVHARLGFHQQRQAILGVQAGDVELALTELEQKALAGPVVVEGELRIGPDVDEVLGVQRHLSSAAADEMRFLEAAANPWPLESAVRIDHDQPVLVPSQKGERLVVVQPKAGGQLFGTERVPLAVPVIRFQSAATSEPGRPPVKKPLDVIAAMT